jgi:iron complex transport system ATP-binding protein
VNELLYAKQLSVAVAGKWLCRDLDLRITAGQRWAVLGPNGSGKTTLLHSLAGLRPAQGGEILIKGRRLGDWQNRLRAQTLGVLLQHYDDPFPSTVLETALIGRHPHLEPWQWESGDDLRRAREALRSMDLDSFEARAVATLSGGERRRLAIATLLTQDPALLLLDEPTNHLDLHHQVRILQLLAHLTADRQRALLMVLHDVTGAAYYCDHALLLFGNGETLIGTTADILTEENLTRLFGHPVRRLTGPDGDVWSPALGLAPTPALLE